MHADRIGDGAQVQRPQVFDAMGEKPVLLAHDLAGDLQYRAGALLQALGQPVGVLQAVRQERLVRLVDPRSVHGRRIGLVDQYARQDLGVEFDAPASVRGGPHDHVGRDRLQRLAAEGAAGFGIEPPDLGDHVENVLVIHAAQSAQGREFALGEQRQVGDQRLHGRVVAVALAQLDGEALGQIARPDAGGIEGLDLREHPLHPRERRAQTLGGLGEVVAEIAGLVERIDQRAADQPVGRIGAGDVELLGQMFGQRRLGGDIGLEIGRLAVARAPACAAAVRPAAPGVGRQAGLLAARGRRGGRGRRIGVEGVGHVSAEVGGQLRAVDSQIRTRPVRLFASLRAARLLGLREPVDRGRGFRPVVAVVGALQQGIAVELVLYEGGEFEMRELQQLDRLQQLRRHHQGLALPHHEPRG